MEKEKYEIEYYSEEELERIYESAHDNTKGRISKRRCINNGRNTRESRDRSVLPVCYSICAASGNYRITMSGF